MKLNLNCNDTMPFGRDPVTPEKGVVYEGNAMNPSSPLGNPEVPNLGSILDVDTAIVQRKTVKVMASHALAVQDPPPPFADLLELAGMAPFHRACDESHRQDDGSLRGIEPWRFYVLDAPQCRSLALSLPKENAGKIPAMLAAADGLFLATWLPNPPENQELPPGQLFEPTLANMEHIAAASAAVQNLLLAATARGLANYWSSGGVLRSQQVFADLRISTREILLGAIFLFPHEADDCEVVGSKLRNHRTNSSCWSRRIGEE